MRIVPLLALFALTACDLVRFGDYDDYGDMTATVRGALDLDLHGTALVSQYPDTAFVVVDLNITNDYARDIRLTTADTVALAVGRYTLGDGSLSRIVYQVDNLTERTFTGTSGSMTVTAVDDTGDAFGRFAFSAVDPDGAEVTVEGSFRARDRRRTYGQSE